MAKSLKVPGRYLLTKQQLVRAIERARKPKKSLPKPALRKKSPTPKPLSRALPARRTPRVPSYSRGLKARGAATTGESSIVPVPAPAPASGIVVDYTLPETYGQTVLVIQARDPQWIHAYWEVTPASYDEAKRSLGTEGKTILRVYELSAPDFSTANIRRQFDVEIGWDARDWFVEVGRPASWWCLEIGLLSSDGRFVSIARSNLIATPADRPSDEIDEQWGTLGEAFASQYGAVGFGGSSARISSPGVPRWGSP